jgi:hypothetical protein
MAIPAGWVCCLCCCISQQQPSAHQCRAACSAACSDWSIDHNGNCTPVARTASTFSAATRRRCIRPSWAVLRPPRQPLTLDDAACEWRCRRWRGAVHKSHRADARRPRAGLTDGLCSALSHCQLGHVDATRLAEQAAGCAAQHFVCKWFKRT